MSEDANSLSNPTLFAAGSLVSHSPKLESSLPKTTPVTSGQKCLELSGNAGPLGLLERTLLGSSNWAWTKYSLTWKAKATPQGRLIFQLARLAPRTSDPGSGLLHTPTAKANQMAPSMMARGPGNWASTLWPTPDATPRGPAKKWTGTRPSGAKESLTLQTAAKMWPTPTSSEGTGAQKNTGRTGGRSLRETVQMWPTPTVQDSANNGGPSQFKRNSLPLNAQVYVTPETDPKTTGSLNPQWVAWLMGYPTEYLNSVHWETASSRRSRNK